MTVILYKGHVLGGADGFTGPANSDCPSVRVQIPDLKQFGISG